MTDYIGSAVALVDPLPLGERRDLLVRWADRLQLHAEAMARRITAAVRKPIRLSRLETERAIGTIRATAAASRQLDPRQVALEGSGSAEIHRVPIGPVLAVTPFNFPLNLAVHKLAPAIAAGCPVLWKPSPKAPGVAELAVELLEQAGAPEGFVRVVHLADEAVARLVEDPRLALLSFTGSATVGRSLQARCRAARCILELGGNAAVILHDPADAAAACRAVAVGACAFAGQVCISVQRILVPEGRDDLVADLTAAFQAVASGDPSRDDVINGPVIDAAARSRIDALLARWRAAGGRCLTGGAWEGDVLQPTLVDGLPPSADGVWNEEAFAPVATLHRYRDFDEALRFAELSPYGLQCGLYARDPALIARAFAQLQVGTLVVDDIPTRRDDRLPYGGMKASGLGREGAFDAVLDYSQPKVLWRPGG